MLTTHLVSFAGRNLSPNWSSEGYTWRLIVVVCLSDVGAAHANGGLGVSDDVKTFEMGGSEDVELWVVDDGGERSAEIACNPSLLMPKPLSS